MYNFRLRQSAWWIGNARATWSVYGTNPSLTCVRTTEITYTLVLFVRLNGSRVGAFEIRVHAYTLALISFSPNVFSKYKGEDVNGTCSPHFDHFLILSRRLLHFPDTPEMFYQAFYFNDHFPRSGRTKRNSVGKSIGNFAILRPTYFFRLYVFRHGESYHKMYGLFAANSNRVQIFGRHHNWIFKW